MMSDSVAKEFTVSQLREADAPDIAKAHAACFEGYFLTGLGQAFLRRFYAEFCRRDTDFGVVARCRETGRVTAFVVGTSDSGEHFRRFYRRNMFVLPPIVLWRVLINRIARREVWRRIGHVKTALLSILPTRSRRAGRETLDEKSMGDCPVRLLSIGVVPDFRGSGVAAAAAAEFEETLRRSGHARVGLSVLAGNTRAIAFYKKAGWRETRSSGIGIWFEKDL